MLEVSGLVVIPENHQLRESPAGTGVYLNFNACSSENRGQERIRHRFQISMWIPADELPSWREKITPGSVFHIRHADLSAEIRIKDDKEVAYPQVKANHKYVRKMKVAMWYQDDQTGATNG